MQTKPHFHDGFSLLFCQNALSAEINDLGMNYGKELLEKPPVISTEQNNHSCQTTVDWEQFQRWKTFLHLTYKTQWKNGFEPKLIYLSLTTKA